MTLRKPAILRHSVLACALASAVVTSALAQDVRGLVVDHELDFIVFDDQVIVFWLIQSHSYARAASAEALDEEADTLAVVFGPVEALEGFVGRVADDDQVQVAHVSSSFLLLKSGTRLQRNPRQ